MTLFASSSNARTFDYQAGDVGFVPASSGTLSESTLQGTCRRILTLVVNLGHYVENIGNTTLHFLEIFNTGESLIPLVFDLPSCSERTSQTVSRILASPRYSTNRLQPRSPH